jgi:two-component system sensor histidine kinase DesK
VSLLRASGIEVHAEVEPGELDPATSVLLGLALREGTTNILRHARARRVWIRVVGDRERRVLEIRNDGATGELRPGTGLHSLSERAAAADGGATASLDPDGTFTLEVTLPVWERV